MAPPSVVSKISMIIPPHQAPSESFITEVGSASGPQSSQHSDSLTDTSLGPGSLSQNGIQSEGPSGKGDTQARLVDRNAAEKKILSYEEISRHRTAENAWIIVDGKVYDVTQFLDTHPGGPELILEHLENEGPKDAGPLMRGNVGPDGHSHSKAAFRMLEQFLVGDVETESRSNGMNGRHEKKYCYNVDLSKPIVAQVGYLGADYDEWVHDPVISKDSPRFFENDFYELFTRTRWWVIPTVWCPVAFAMIYVAVTKEGVPPARLPGLFVAGVAIWSILEYLLHRFLFHMKTSSFWGNTLHYLLHGFHHKHPMDGSRLVFPPVFASIICIGIWFLMGSWMAIYPNKLVVYAAALLGYVAYDLTHYFLHFGTAFTDQVRKMKRYHLNHHFKDQKNGFGITTIIWDWVFKTLPSAKASKD